MPIEDSSDCVEMKHGHFLFVDNEGVWVAEEPDSSNYLPAIIDEAFILLNCNTDNKTNKIFSRITSEDYKY